MRRRAFLLACAGLGVTTSRRSSAQAAIAVDAIPTLFHGHPDGTVTLVRFSASGVDAPAGRLRVQDLRTGRLLGTAGMIPRDGRLRGELWIPLTGPRGVRTELETPRRPGAIRTVHRLVPTPRWTIYWLTLASPADVHALFADVPPLLRGAQAQSLIPAGIRLNPWHALTPDADHLDLIRVTMPAAQAARATGIPLSRVALFDGPPPEEVVRVLRGAAVDVIADGKRIVDPRTLDLAAGRVRAASRIEAWLLARGAVAPEASPIAVAVGTDPSFAVAARSNVDDWNTAYAFPRFTVGDGDEIIRGLRAVGADVAAATALSGRTDTREAAGGAAAGLPDPPVHAADAAFLPLTRAISPEDPTLGGIAHRFAFPVGGLLVFNGSPFGRSGPVLAPDGAVRMVTDVPGMGYAFVPDAPPPSVVVREHEDTLETKGYRVRIDRSNGGIASLIHRASGTNLVAPGAVLNGLADAVLSDVRAEVIGDAGTRVVARRVTGRHVITTTTTAYEDTPWIEIENEVDPSADDPGDWIFGFDHATARVIWEIPGGMREQEPPVTDLAPIRWLALRGPAGTLMLGTGGRVTGMVDAAGRLTLRGPGTSRIRIELQQGRALPDDPWRFGFGMEPLTAVPTSGRGAVPLPTFGRMVDVADPLVSVLAVRAATDAVGVMVYLQDVGGPPRDIVMRAGLLAFDGAILTDLAERDVREAPADPAGGVRVPIEEAGYAAVRLLGVRLAS